MHNMSDIIEQYIKRLFEESNEDVVEIHRANITFAVLIAYHHS